MQAVLDAIVEPKRRDILDLLRAGERQVGELVDELGVAQPTVSKHLKVMRDAGLVTVRPEAQRRWYRLRPDALMELDEWLETYRQAWVERLDVLERHLDEMEDR